jgi:hypothetical protein
MIKSFVLIIFSLALSFSVLAPSLNSFLDLKSDYSILGDFSEEEPNQSEKEIYEKDIVFIVNHKFEPYQPTQCSVLSGFYKEDTSKFDGKILLPPPERNS